MESSPQKRYMIFFKGHKGNYGGHAVVHLVEAPTRVDALYRLIESAYDMNVTRYPDGSLQVDGIAYAHPLAYIEASFKRYGEWQMRLVREPTQEEPCKEVFCGEDAGSVDALIAECRRKFGKKRAKAFVWYLRQGVLVTFYRAGKPLRIKIRKRYLCGYDYSKWIVKPWKGDYTEILDTLLMGILMEEERD